VMVMVAAWIIVSVRRSPEPVDRRVLAARFGGFILTLGSSCALSTLHFDPGSLPQTAGGAFGETIGGGLADSMGGLGATVLLLAVWLGAVSVFTGVSWVAVMDRL